MLRERRPFEVEACTRGFSVTVAPELSMREVDVVLASDVIALMRRRLGHAA